MLTDLQEELERLNKDASTAASAKSLRFVGGFGFRVWRFRVYGGLGFVGVWAVYGSGLAWHFTVIGLPAVGKRRFQFPVTLASQQRLRRPTS